MRYDSEYLHKSRSALADRGVVTFRLTVWRCKIKDVPHTDPTTSPVSEEQKRAALTAVLASESFARSEQLRAFLSLVCEMEIAGRTAELTEYLIGVKALGRPPDYSPLGDSSVRTRAYELRQRLARFYSVENPDAPVHIVVPKGSYAPDFQVWTAAPAPAPILPRVRAPRRFHLPAGSLVGFAVGVAVTSIAALLLTWRAEPGGPDPVLKQAWAPLLSRDAEIVISVGSPLHLQITPYPSVQEDRPIFSAPSDLYPLFTRFRELPKGAKLQMEPVQKAIPMGSVEGVAKVMTALQTLHARTRILPETTSPLSALRGKSAVLFGSTWYSRSVSALLEKTPWTIHWDGDAGEVALIGQGSRQGLKLLPRRGPRGEFQEVFGLVSVLQNESSAGGDRSIVVFSGLTSVGIYGAAAFFTSIRDLRVLAERFHKDGLTGWPKAFQVVVRCRASDDAQLLSYAYETHDVLMR
jgi:hypothetical protein